MIPFLTEEVWQLLREVAPARGFGGAGLDGLCKSGGECLCGGLAEG